MVGIDGPDSVFTVFAVAGVLGVAAIVLVAGTAAAFGVQGVNIDDFDNKDFNDDLKEISFVGFCTADDVNGNAEITNTYTDGEGGIVSIDWSSHVDISTVVLKYGQTFEDFAGVVSGTATVGEGTEASGRMSDSPCPDGEYLLVKYNNQGGEFVKESGDE